MDLEITTHAQCSQETMPALLERFARCLEPLDADMAGLRAWLATLEWLPDDGFGGLGPPLTLYTHDPERMRLTVKPHMFTYTVEMLPGSTGLWVALSLVLENGTEEFEVCVTDPPTYPVEWRYPGDEWRFPRAFGVAVLDVMGHLLRGFPDEGVYLADDGNVDVSWVAQFTGEDKLWGGNGLMGGFDLALIPDHIASRLSEMPNTYARVQLPGAMGVTRLAAWIENPLEPLPDVIARERTPGV